jgi:N-acetylglutamate synthase-like GNAT family acetyltransferase
MEDVRIQVYDETFQQGVIDLILNIQQKEFGVPITIEAQPDLTSIPSFYQKGTGNFWVALFKNEVIGTIALIDIGNYQVALRKMFVKEQFRGKEYGTAQRLLDASIAWMKEKNCSEVFLGTIDIFQAAQKFYRRNGFEEVAKENLPAAFPLMPLDNRFFSKKISTGSALELLDYQDVHQPLFERFNRDWIEKYFWMEPVDFDVLKNPKDHILGKGGKIIMAAWENKIAGTVALKFVEPGVYEFTKMAVDHEYRGKKIGQALADAAIKKARSLGARKIILYSNTVLEPAIALYRKIGFKEVPVDGTYERSDIKMELNLNGYQ